jgi:hydroxypyruvate isomerase
MLSFSANLSLLFTEVEFLERFALASSAGFRAVECQFPYPYRREALAEQLQRCGLVQALINLPPGDWSKGDRGIACLPDRIAEFQDSVACGIEYATALGCTRVNCLAGIPPSAADPFRLRETFIENLRFAARELEQYGITLVIEPLNSRDVPGFYVGTSGQAVEIIRDVGAANLRLQFDVYHAHIMEPDAVASIHRHMGSIGHVQIADNPGRHEPGTGRIDFDSVFGALQDANYGGWVGCEYVPSTTTEKSLQWLYEYRSARA